MKSLVIYRILSVLLHLFGLLIAVGVVTTLPAIANPLVLLNAFISVSVILYIWLSRRFFLTVVQEGGVITRRRKDWLKVNAVVASIFALIALIDLFIAIAAPAQIAEALKRMGSAANPEQARLALKILTIPVVVLIIHIAWTFVLLRKFRDHIV